MGAAGPLTVQNHDGSYGSKPAKSNLVFSASVEVI